jgi:hypothetical protein
MTALAMLIALAQPATRLSVQPWTGSDFQVTTSGAARYRLEVDGKPDSVDLALPRSGDAVVQFELIRESENAPKQSGATITDDDGASVSVPAASR